MSKEKQIEEMTKDLGIAFQLAGTTRFGAVAEILVNAGYRKASDVAKLEEKLADVTANWQKIHDGYDNDCIEHYNKGRSDAIVEIIDTVYEILQELKDDYLVAEDIREACALRHGMIKVVELKKKYTESEKDNGN